MAYQGGPPSHPRMNHPKAVQAIVAACIAWAVCPIVPAVVALSIAGTASREMAESPGMFEGETMIKAARILSWANIVFYVLLGVVLTALLA